MNIIQWLNQLYWTLLPKRVYGFIGEAGTGKSFRAYLVAEKYKIDYIIDDGLLIKDRQIIAGGSSKQEKYLTTAAKTAIFSKLKHALDVRRKLAQEKYRKILVIATSQRMLEKICERLALPKPIKIIRIEDMATDEEIHLARINRIKYGGHVIPIPIDEVKKEHASIILHALHMFIERRKGVLFKKRKSELVEKTIVKPDYTEIGKITITENAIFQMTRHSMAEYSQSVKLLKVNMKRHDNGYSLWLNVIVNSNLKNKEFIKTIQQKVKNKIQAYTGILIHKVEIEVSNQI